MYEPPLVNAIRLFYVQEVWNKTSGKLPYITYRKLEILHNYEVNAEAYLYLQYRRSMQLGYLTHMRGQQK